MNRRLALLVALLTAAWVSNVQAADEWKTYRYPQDGFTAEFPAAPDVEHPKFNPRRNIRDTQYWSEANGVTYGVGASLFHHRVIASEPSAKQLVNVVDAVRRSLKCSLGSARTISLPGATGREAVLVKCKQISGDAMIRAVIAGDRLFQLMVLGGPPGLADSADTKRFMKSFSLTAQ